MGKEAAEPQTLRLKLKEEVGRIASLIPSIPSGFLYHYTAIAFKTPILIMKAPTLNEEAFGGICCNGKPEPTGSSWVWGLGFGVWGLGFGV